MPKCMEMVILLIYFKKSTKLETYEKGKVFGKRQWNYLIQNDAKSDIVLFSDNIELLTKHKSFGKLPQAFLQVIQSGAKMDEKSKSSKRYPILATMLKMKDESSRNISQASMQAPQSDTKMDEVN